MTPKKFLSVITGFILVSILIAIVLFMVRDRLPQYLDEKTPVDVVSNYLTAILREDYDRAYGYLGDWPEKPEFGDFEVRLNGLTGYQFCLDIPEYSGFDAGIKTPTTVYIDSYRCDQEWQINWETYDKVEIEPYIGPNEARLNKVNGVWKIEQMPLPWWDEAWLSTNTDRE